MDANIANTKAFFQSVDIPEDIIKNFVDNGITIEHFKDLTDNLLKELCPHIGHRINIRNAIHELIEATADTEPCLTSDAPSSLMQDSDVEVSDHSQEPVFTDITTSLNRPALPDFDLKTLLQTSAHGNNILNYYKQYKGLNAKKRNILTDIVVKHLYTYIVNNKLKPEDYNILGAKIISAFPCETLDTYYVKAVPTCKSLTGRYIPAQGKLADKVRNLLYISGERRRSSINKTTDTSGDFSENAILDDDDVLWLKNNNDPWEDVISKWKKTFRLRVRHTNSSTVHDFLENWSILKTDRGHVLINSDFEELFKDKSLNFHKNWHGFFEKLLILKKAQVNNKNALSLIETLSAITDEDKKIPLQMSLLAYLVPPKGRLSRTVKYSSKESTEGLIIQTETAGDIDKVIDEKKTASLKRKLPVQPYIIVQGSLHNFDSLYMVIDDVRYVFDSAGKAFDLLFKMYHVFHVRYPNASEYLYLIIQRKVYGIVTKYDTVRPHVAEILNMQ